MSTERERTPLTGLVLMALFTLWSGGLGIGFAVVVALSARELGAARVVLFVFAAVLLLGGAARTAYELLRRLRANDRD